MVEKEDGVLWSHGLRDEGNWKAGQMTDFVSSVAEGALGKNRSFPSSNEWKKGRRRSGKREEERKPVMIQAQQLGSNPHQLFT
jgi:hypothetical protein